jgi:hypothetical protein
VKKGLIGLSVLASMVGMGAIGCNLGPTELPTLPSGYIWYHHDIFGFDIGYPEDWEIESWGVGTSSSYEASFFSVVIRDNSISDGALEAGVDQFPYDVNFEGYVAAFKEHPLMQGFSIVDEGHIVVNGRAGYQFVALNEVVQTKQRCAIFTAEGKGYFIICTAPEAFFYLYEDNFDSIIDSFVIR